jgi:signal transduction histidine kinase
MIDQLRAYVQSRTIPLGIGTVDVAPLCAAALRAAQSQADARAVQLRLAFDVEETTVAGDAGAIRRILDNLLLNAIAASPAGAEVVLRVHSDDDSTITLTVADAGSGLSPAQHKQIFEPLVRFRSGSGLGLGLAIVRELTRAMHAAYGVNSALGGGSAFWIRLPRASDREKEGSHADSPGD